MLEVRMNKAKKGECIWLRYGEEEKTNILIDSGPASFEREFREVIKSIKDKGENVDLLILSHIDDDHIKGFAKYIKTSECTEIKEIWLNGYGTQAYETNEFHSPRNITSLVTQIEEKGIKITTPIYEGYKQVINSAVLTVIGPTEEAIYNVAKKVDSFVDHTAEDEKNKDLDEIMKSDIFTTDTSLTNKASIVFVFSYANKKIAFLGDAYAEDVVAGMKKYFNEIPMDLVKLGHHGSKYNTNIELLEVLQAKKFMISTNKHIHKQTVARLTQIIRDKIIIYCNYDWWTSTNFFTQNDKEKYIDEEKLKIINLDNNCIPNI